MARSIVMPSLGMYTAEGTVSAWLRESGDAVEEGDDVLEVTTEKTTFVVPAPVAGVVHRVAPAGSEVAVEGILGWILAPGEAVPLATAPESRPASPASAPPPTVAPAAGSGEVRASPAARRLAREHGVDLAAVEGTGPGGRIIEADVLAWASSRGKA